MKKHDEMVCEALEKLAKEVDVIAFSQISMSLIDLPETEVPVYRIGESGFQKIKEMMDAAK